MRFSIVSTLVLGIGFALSVPSFAADVAEGQKVFLAKCKTCHGPTGAGNPGMAKALKVDIHDLGSADVQKKTDAELKKNTSEGVGKMKPIAGLSAGDLDNVTAFIRSLKK